jgi:hypothetical protein
MTGLVSPQLVGVIVIAEAQGAPKAPPPDAAAWSEQSLDYG